MAITESRFVPSQEVESPMAKTPFGSQLGGLRAPAHPPVVKARKSKKVTSPTESQRNDNFEYDKDDELRQIMKPVEETPANAQTPIGKLLAMAGDTNRGSSMRNISTKLPVESIVEMDDEQSDWHHLKPQHSIR